MAARHIARKLWQPKFPTKYQRRGLALQEHQSKQLLREFGIPVQNGKVATTAGEVPEIMRQYGRLISLLAHQSSLLTSRLAGGKCVINSQILKGGRGKGTFDNGFQGGVKIAKLPEDGERISSQMLGHRLRTKQTSGDGILVEKVLVAEFEECDEEWYLAIALDRERYSPVVLISRSGGVDIEDTAKGEGGSLRSFHFDYAEGITPDLLNRLRTDVGASPAEAEKLGAILVRLWDLFVSRDATLLEINPLARTGEADFKCLDAKFLIDDASQRRQPELFAQRDIQAEIPEEIEAQKYGLVYIKMEGNIGNVVNGAGLAMATNDAIAHHGGASANFLDAGGQATQSTMQKAFEIILRDDRVKVILVNIYGGIIKCDMIAESIIGATKELGRLPVPLVVRLQGTNSAEGLKILEEADLGFHVESEFGAAAKKAVQLSKS
ncbi:beta-succinyl synthetase precursor [Fusarium circinatum]|uniref:Succinate--CoA ligase [ADP-forming] subunit beta, mitochondrial n=1 Tax=Fusarium circinatum TaxID=48490 RepID=A0A8H5T4A1_FUSCI|nr:beta-succinyl synthetase precursor [Fusarium circinatum]